MDIEFSSEYKNLGLNIAFYRKKKGYSQQHFAELLNISESHVGGIEQGKHGSSLDLIWKMSRILDVSPDKLFIF